MWDITSSQEFLIKSIVLGGIGAHNQVDLVGDIVVLVGVHVWRYQFDRRRKVVWPLKGLLNLSTSRSDGVKVGIYIAGVTRVTAALLLFFSWVVVEPLQDSETCSRSIRTRHLKQTHTYQVMLEERIR